MYRCDAIVRRKKKRCDKEAIWLYKEFNLCQKHLKTILLAQSVKKGDVFLIKEDKNV